MKNGFGWDDELIIFTLAAPEFWWHLFRPEETYSYFRPLINISYLIERSLWGKDPFGYHLSVLFFHSINTILVFFLARNLVLEKPGSHPGAPSGGDTAGEGMVFPLMSSSLFAVYPAHAESVAWIAGRTDVLCTTFLLASLVSYIRFNRSRRAALFLLSMVFYLFALFCKEIAIAFVLIFPLLEFLDESGKGKRSKVKRFFPTMFPMGILALYFVLRGRGSGGMGESVSESGHLSDFSAVMEALRLASNALGYYFQFMVWPYPQVPIIDSMPNGPGVFFLGIPLVILFVTIWILALIKKQRVHGICGGILFLTLAPAVALPVLGASTTPVAERYTYAPSVGLLVGFAWAASRFMAEGRFPRGVSKEKGRAAIYGVLTLLILIWGLESSFRNGVWESQVRFWEAAVAASPGSGISHGELGLRYAALGRLEEAGIHYQAALIRLEKTHGPEHPSMGKVLHNSGDLFRAQGKGEAAEVFYKKALGIFERQIGEDDSTTLKTKNNLAVLYSTQGRFTESEALFGDIYLSWSRSLPSDHPQVLQALSNLALVYRKQGKLAEAEELLGRDSSSGN